LENTGKTEAPIKSFQPITARLAEDLFEVPFGRVLITVNSYLLVGLCQDEINPNSGSGILWPALRVIGQDVGL
jgi:hypothetical protein